MPTSEEFWKKPNLESNLQSLQLKNQTQLMKFCNHLKIKEKLKNKMFNKIKNHG